MRSSRKSRRTLKKLGRDSSLGQYFGAKNRKGAGIIQKECADDSSSLWL